MSYISSTTTNPVVGAYAHTIQGGQCERWRVTEVTDDRRHCTIQRDGITMVARKYEYLKGLWKWHVPGLNAIINFTNVPPVGYLSETSSPEGGIIRSIVKEVSEDGTQVTLTNGTVLVLAEHGGYPNTRFKAAR